MVYKMIVKEGILKNTIWSVYDYMTAAKILSIDDTISVGYIHKTINKDEIDIAASMYTGNNEVWFCVYDTHFEEFTEELHQYGKDRNVKFKMGSAYTVDDLIRYSDFEAVEVAYIPWPLEAMTHLIQAPSQNPCWNVQLSGIVYKKDFKMDPLHKVGGVSTKNYWNSSWEGMTFDFWINPVEQEGDPIIISNKNWNSGVNRGFVIALKREDLIINFGDGQRRIDILQGIPKGWSHWTIVFDLNNKIIAGYLNGYKTFTETIPDDCEISAIQNYNPITIGQDATMYYKYSLHAELGTVTIYNRVLTDQEIEELEAIDNEFITETV